MEKTDVNFSEIFLLVSPTRCWLPWAMMRCWVILCFLSLALTPNTRARIGETPEQCEARYGKPFQITPEWNAYRKADFIIVMVFFNKRAETVIYYKNRDKEHPDSTGPRNPLSEEEIEQLRSAESGGKSWKRVEGSFVKDWQITADGSLLSLYDSQDRELYISTKAAATRSSATKKAETAKSLEGF